MKIDINNPNQTVRGPHGLVLKLNAGDIFPDDPGLGTPCLFEYRGETMTLECGSAGGNIGELGCPQASIDWATSDDLYTQATDWLDHQWKIAEAKTLR
jgi:hypothetical protein